MNLNTKIKNLILISFFIAYSSITESFAERKICIIGDATPNGWDKGSASPLSNTNNSSTTFCYKGYLKTGNFKFIFENTDDSWLPTWNKADDTHQSRNIDFEKELGLKKTETSVIVTGKQIGRAHV